LISNDYIDYIFSSTTNQQTSYDYLSSQALGRGIDRFMNKDYEGAVKEFKLSIGLAPNSEYSSKAYEYTANAYQNMNRVGDAVKTYKQMVQLNPSDDRAHLKLGNIYFRSSQYKEAEQEYTQAVRINPGSAENRYALALSYLATGKYREAELQSRSVIQITPRDSNGYDALGQALRKQERFDDAVLQFKKAISLDKKNADAYLDLGYTYADMKKLDEAQRQADLLKKIDSGKANDLQDYIKQASDPKLFSVFSTGGFPLSSGRGTVLSTMDDALEIPNASKDFSVTFMFDKDMDPLSVQNPGSWQIRRAVRSDPGGAYNLGLGTPSTEVMTPSSPYRVAYNSDAKTAEVTFRLTQNTAGTGTIDPSHLIFKFKGIDAYGNAMDPSADEYSGISKIV
jgi:tetratricopeptide (TPR) repeat protein